ncbi:MAG: altronate dehydratase family protein [Paracoccaceae bacterium]
MTSPDAIRLAPEDDVATALRPLEVGVAVHGATTAALIPRGHKVALRKLAKGEPVRKYGQIIGYAARDVAPGEHVHEDALEFRATDHAYEFATDLRPPRPVETPATFLGYRRAQGRAGTRNHVAVVTSVNCSATAARMIADAFGPADLAPYPNVDGVTAFVHGTGCGMAGDGDGFEALQRVMWGYAKHPNHAAVLMVGLGCEMNQIDWLLEAYGIERGPRFQTMNIQDVAGLRRTVETGIAKVREMLPIANETAREPVPASHLALALQCGGSDAWSGITANPALGHCCDRLAAEGGVGLLAETPEIYGAEHLLTRRAATRGIGEKLVDRIRWWEDYVARNKGSMNNNPSPGNKRGGLTTILEKSLGAAAKGGTTPLNGVLKYAEPIGDAAGFLFMDSPGYDPASVTGQIASGCNMVAFTTGRGSAFGSKPAPTIKIATNAELARRMPEDMDVDAGAILTGEKTVEEVGEEIHRLLLRAASGEPTKSEAQGLGDHEFVPWQIGAVM